MWVLGVISLYDLGYFGWSLKANTKCWTIYEPCCLHLCLSYYTAA